MSWKDVRSRKPEDLRKLAEAAARQKASAAFEGLDASSTEEMRRTLYDLRVHQIELEMQNEELLRTHVELDTARARYFDLYDQAPVGYCLVARDGSILEANLTAATLLGEPRKALIAQSITRFILQEDQDIHYRHRKDFLAGGEPYECELRLVRKNGTVFWGHMTVVAAQGPSKHPEQSLVHFPLSRLMLNDISERKRAEAETSRLETQLQQAQKLQAIGVLAGGVAHDFNNLLAVIVGNANLGSLAVERDSKVAHHFETIEMAAMKGAALTAQLLAYAGKGRCLATEVDLEILIKEVTRIVAMPANVDLRYDPADRLPFVKGDATQIFQILMNLVTNASEAIEDGREGRIVVRTRAERIEEDVAGSGPWALPLAPGHYATIEVADSGIGMAPEIMALVFDPFFTTKFTGRGLGLAAVIGTLGTHGGGIRVKSELGHGSSFKIFLPAMLGARTAPAGEDLPAWRGEGRILVVDDEQEVRSAARQMAERLGFTVLEAWGGLEAVDLFRVHHEELALVLLDLSMPRMGGWEALRELRKIDRRVPVVLSSGYDMPAAATRIEGLAGFLKKPYRIAELQKLLQRSLAQRAPAQPASPPPARAVEP